MNYALAAGQEIENLTATVGTGLTLTGNEFANTITGGDGNDIIDGAAGADTMIGGLGDDTYTVDDAGDVVTEAVAEGTDTVNTAINYTLGANVENLTDGQHRSHLDRQCPGQHHHGRRRQRYHRRRRGCRHHDRRSR